METHFVEGRRFTDQQTLEVVHEVLMRINGDFVLPQVNATDDPSSIGKADAVLVCVKSWQVREAVESIGASAGE